MLGEAVAGRMEPAKRTKFPSGQVLEGSNHPDNQGDFALAACVIRMQAFWQQSKDNPENQVRFEG
jgi:hypothetical protein